jgi:signal transduction histidine kinase
VDASRHLARGRFDHRVEVRQGDEFDELAEAFNHLAEQLQRDEQRRLEMLQQVAATLNHELNNAMAIIELQLRLMQKQAGRNETFDRCLHQIHEGLRRMSSTVEALKRVRRIVLTDYSSSGARMLDLERSTETEPDEDSSSIGGPR